jgi:hypothetical protein
MKVHAIEHEKKQLQTLLDERRRRDNDDAFLCTRQKEKLDACQSKCDALEALVEHQRHALAASEAANESLNMTLKTYEKTSADALAAQAGTLPSQDLHVRESAIPECMNIMSTLTSITVPAPQQRQRRQQQQQQHSWMRCENLRCRVSWMASNAASKARDRQHKMDVATWQSREAYLMQALACANEHESHAKSAVERLRRQLEERHALKRDYFHLHAVLQWQENRIRHLEMKQQQHQCYTYDNEYTRQSPLR